MIRFLAHSLFGGVALWLLMAILGLNWRVLIAALGLAVLWALLDAVVYLLMGKEK